MGKVNINTLFCNTGAGKLVPVLFVDYQSKGRIDMTLQQLKYIVTIAETGNITEAAKRLFISQPSLTNAIRELEKEMQITIFNRTNKGVIISGDYSLFQQPQYVYL